MNKCYIASPFFNKEQLDTVTEIEKALDNSGINYFSPRSEGVLIEMTDEERENKFKNIYNSNILHMEECNTMIAVIDDWDTGVCVEIGYYIKSAKAIFTYSANNYGLNVMVRQGVTSHNTKINNIITNIKQYIDCKSITIFDELTKKVT